MPTSRFVIVSIILQRFDGIENQLAYRIWMGIVYSNNKDDIVYIMCLCWRKKEKQKHSRRSAILRETEKNVRRFFFVVVKQQRENLSSNSRNYWISGVNNQQWTRKRRDPIRQARAVGHQYINISRSRENNECTCVFVMTYKREWRYRVFSSSLF